MQSITVLTGHELLVSVASRFGLVEPVAREWIERRTGYRFAFDALYLIRIPESSTESDAWLAQNASIHPMSEHEIAEHERRAHESGGKPIGKYHLPKPSRFRPAEQLERAE